MYYVVHWEIFRLLLSQRTPYGIYSGEKVNHIMDLDKHTSNQAIKQASKKTDFTVDLIWWGSLKLTPIKFVDGRVTRYSCRNG